MAGGGDGNANGNRKREGKGRGAALIGCDILGFKVGVHFGGAARNDDPLL